MYIPEQPLAPWKASVTVLHVVAICMTVLRLSFRYSRRRLWLDDYAIAAAALVDIVAVVTIWLMYVDTESAESFHNNVALYWLFSIPWYTVIWFTRIALVLTITRIFPIWGTLRRMARGTAISFLIVYIGFMAWLFTTNCKNLDSDTPLEINFLRCNPERNSLTIIAISDTAACLFLFLSPIAILWFYIMHRGQQILTITLLASNTLVLSSVLVLCVFLYSSKITGPGRPLVIGMISQLESAISIICCNLTVVVVYLHRNCIRGPDSIDDAIQWKKTVVVAKTQTVPARLPLAERRPVDNQNQSYHSEWSSHQTFANKYQS